MSFTLHKLENGSVFIRITADSLPEFQRAMFRATNTWPDISEVMDEFSQQVQFGKIVYKKLPPTEE